MNQIKFYSIFALLLVLFSCSDNNDFNYNQDYNVEINLADDQKKMYKEFATIRMLREYFIRENGRIKYIQESLSPNNKIKWGQYTILPKDNNWKTISIPIIEQELLNEYYIRMIFWLDEKDNIQDIHFVKYFPSSDSSIFDEKYSGSVYYFNQNNDLLKVFEYIKGEDYSKNLKIAPQQLEEIIIMGTYSPNSVPQSWVDWASVWNTDPRGADHCPICGASYEDIEMTASRDVVCTVCCFGGGGSSGSNSSNTGEQYPNLTEAEKDFVKKHPIVALKFKANADKANKRTASYNGQHNGQADALRHAYWSALNAFSHGINLAREFGNAHENNPDQPKNEKDMDLHNNSVGYDIGVEASENNWNEDRIWVEVINSYNNDKLVTLK